MNFRTLAFACLAALLFGVSLSGTTSRAQERCVSGFTCDDPQWRFTYPSRRVKVVLLAGSIGAFQDEPYGRLIHEWCENAEVRNLSHVGFGAYQLHQVFQDEVVRNARFPFGNDQLELWVLWNGGLNSAASANRTNRYIRRVFVDAHRRGMHVAGMTLSPWGSLRDARRWGGANALETYRNTRSIVDMVMCTAQPRQALGSYGSDRESPDAPWAPSELADVHINLFDSSLRDANAPLRDVDAMRALVERDGGWRRRVEGLAEAERAQRLDADARLLSEMPRWFLRPGVRGFDPIHPNREGHREIARLACPRLPASWGCHCPTQ